VIKPHNKSFDERGRPWPLPEREHVTSLTAPAGRVAPLVLLSMIHLSRGIRPLMRCPDQPWGGGGGASHFGANEHRSPVAAQNMVVLIGHRAIFRDGTIGCPNEAGLSRLEGAVGSTHAANDKIGEENALVHALAVGSTPPPKGAHGLVISVSGFMDAEYSRVRLGTTGIAYWVPQKSIAP
jgi:hypothetical protein